MKKLILFGTAFLLVAVVGFKNPTEAKSANLESFDVTCSCGPVAAFKMNNGGVYLGEDATIRFVGKPVCGDVTFYWHFVGSGVTKTTSTNILETTVGDVQLPVGTTDVNLSYTINLVPGGTCVSGPGARVQSVTRIAE